MVRQRWTKLTLDELLDDTLRDGVSHAWNLDDLGYTQEISHDFYDEKAPNQICSPWKGPHRRFGFVDERISHIRTDEAFLPAKARTAIWFNTNCC